MSDRTILRKLKQMTKEEGPIVSLNTEQVKKYGKQETDGRAKYLTLKGTVERKKHLDDIFKLLSAGDDIDKKMVLYEIKRYEKEYILYPNQLDAIVLNLDSEDAGLIDNLLGILYKHIINKEIKPKNETILLEKLGNLLERYPEEHKKYTMLRRRSIWLLVYYNDKVVLEQLKKDIETGRLSSQKGDYWDWYTARVIEEGRTELFYLENKLRKEGSTETADALAEIRDQAEINAKKPRGPDEPWEAAISNVGQIPIKGIKK